MENKVFYNLFAAKPSTPPPFFKAFKSIFKCFCRFNYILVKLLCVTFWPYVVMIGFHVVAAVFNVMIDQLPYVHVFIHLACPYSQGIGNFFVHLCCMTNLGVLS